MTRTDRLATRLASMIGQRPIPLRLKLWRGEEISLADDPLVTLHVRSPKAVRRLLRPDLASLGEAYVEGLVDMEGAVSDAIAIASRLAQGGAARQPQGGAARSWQGGAARQSHVGVARLWQGGVARLHRGGLLPAWMGRYSRQRTREAIAYHYDVSNEFYAGFLDRQMVYSCAYYRTGLEDLETAQLQKLDHVCRKLRLKPGLRLLDVGCGWGALVIRAAERYGVSALGITLSREQFELARRRVHAAGLSDRVEIRLQDYRDVGEPAGFDRIASIGMFEHVGLAGLPGYFQCLHDLLKPGGIVLNHGITAAHPDSRSVGAGGGKFIDRYVFPDGELPHVSLAIRELSAAGLELADAESLRRHYALTLQAWSKAFEANFDRLRILAGERRARIWRVYLAGCAWAFAQGWINLYQLLAVRPEAGDGGLASPLPLSRDYMYLGEWPPARPDC